MSTTHEAHQHLTLEVRAPTTEDEVQQWGALCARGFSHRSGAPDRFYAKYCADPTARMDWVRIGVAPGGKFVGSIRILQRTVVIGGRAASFGGVAEVCTDPEARGQGVANQMMADTVALLDGGSGCELSLLHAAAGVAPLYARYGYLPLFTEYGRLPLADMRAAASSNSSNSASSDDGLPAGYSMRRACFPDDAAAMARLYEPSQARLGAQGYVARSAAYWASWMPWVTAGNEWVLMHDGGGGDILAYAQVGRREGVLKVQDFASSPGCQPALAQQFLAGVADAFMEQERSAAAAAAANATAGATGAAAVAALAPAPVPVPAVVPTLVDDATLVGPVLLLRWLAPKHSAPVAALTDDRWMARPVAGVPGADAAVAALQEACTAGTMHLWDVDWF
jgi:predicted GNAT family N-acyltransferase